MKKVLLFVTLIITVNVTGFAQKNGSEIKQCLDSIILPEVYKEIFSYNGRGDNTLLANYYWDENRWKGSFKKEFKYDIHGNKTQFAFYNWNYDNDDWIVTNQEEFGYDDKGNVISYIFCCWDNNVLIDKFKRESEYNSDGNETINIRYGWDFEENKWIKMFKGVSSYEDGKLTEYIDYELIGTQWIEYYKIEHKYENGRETLWMIYEWMGTWQFSSKGETKYDSHGNETLYIESMWNGSTWIDMFKSKTDYKYDNAGNMTELISYYWGENDWVIGYKSEYEYDDDRNVIMSASYGWDNEEKKWTGWEKYEYQYNDGNLDSMISYQWETMNWIESHKYKYEYDENKNMIVSEGYNWENDDWVESDRQEHCYDLSYSKKDLVVPPDMNMNNKKIEEKSYLWDGKDWIVNNVVKYYWSEKEINGIDDLKQTFSSVTIYPNPASSEIHILSDTKEITDYVIYNSIGQTVMYGTLQDNFTINISGLQSGIYIIRIKADHKVISKKIVIN